MKIRIHRPALAALAAALVLSPAPLASQAPGPVHDSFLRAVAVVREAAEAHGGADAIRSLRGMQFRWEGTVWLRTQGVRASEARSAAPSPHPVAHRYAFDLTRGRALREVDAHLPGGYRNRNRTVIAGRELFSFDVGRAFGGDALSRDTSGLAAAQRLPANYDAMPALVLRQALARAATLRWVGEGTLEGRPQRIVTFADADGRQVALWFDAQTRRLTRHELAGEDPVLGDVTRAAEFSEYETVSGIAVPRRMRTTLGGMPVEDVRLASVEVNPTVADSLWQAPKDYVPTTPAAGGPAMERFAEGVWFIERLGGGYRSLVVDTDSGLVVLDAPLSPAVVEQAIGLIARTLPDRPIRWVALTHHHADHVGGLRAYVARGATILVPAGTEGYFRAMLAAPRTSSAPDALARAPREPVFETVTGRKTIGRGPSRVDILAGGPTSHADGMLLAYVPAARLLFQGDFLRLNDPGTVGPAIDVTVELAELIRRRGLDVRTIAAVHGRNGTMEDLREALRKREAGR